MRKNLFKCLSMALALVLSTIGWIGSAEGKAVARDPLAVRKTASKNATKSSGKAAKYARLHNSATQNKALSKSKKK
jgi:hypothetical protein